MANKKNKIPIQIDFSSNIKLLEEINNSFKNISSNEKLISNQGNTVKSTYASIGSLLSKLSNYQKENSVITVSELKKIQGEYEKVKTSLQRIGSIEEQEHSKRINQLNIEKEKTDKLVESLKKAQEAQESIKSDLNKAKISLNKAQTLDDGNGKIPEEIKNRFSEKSLNLYNKEGLSSVKTLSEKKIGVKTSAEDKERIEAAKEFVEVYKKIIEEREAEVKLMEKTLEKQQDLTKAAQEELDNNKSSITSLSNEISQSSENISVLNNLNKSLEKGYEGVTKQSNYMVESGEKQAQVTDKVESRTTKLIKTGIVYRAVMNTVRKIMNASVKTVIEMDKALTDMSIVTGESREELYALVPTLNKLGQACGATATEMASLTAEYMKQGRTMKDSLELAEQTAKAAKIAGISVSDSIEYMTSAVNGFNLAATDAEHVSDIFAKVAASTATDYEELAVSLSKVSAQANTAGLSIEFTTALLAKGIETTKEAPESIGTALKTILARMRELTDYGSVLEDDTSINKVERALASAGVELRTTTGEFRDLEEVFKELGPKWDNLNTMQQQAIAQAVAGTRQQSRFLAIMQDWDRTLEISSTTLDAAGASAYQYSQYAKSLEYSMVNLTTAWQGLVATFTNTDIIKGGLDVISNILNAFTGIMNLGNGFVGNLTATVALITAATLGAKKWRLTQLNQLDDLIEQQVVLKGISREQAIQNLAEEKRLTLAQKILLTKQKEAALAKKDKYDPVKSLTKQLKLKESESKKLKEIVDRNKAIGKFSEQNTNANKELMTFLATANIKESERLLIAKQLDVLNNKKLVDSAIQEGLEVSSLVNAKALADEKGIELKEEKLITVAKIQNGSLTIQQAIAEGKITEEEVKQLGLEKLQNNEGKKGLLFAIKKRAESVKDTIVDTGGAIASLVKQLGLAGIPIAAAVAATIGGLIGTAINVNSNSNRQKSISTNQETIYENKESSSKLKSLKEEYEDIIRKQNIGMATSEELDRLKEIEEELKEIDKNLVGTGEALINKIDGKITSLNEDVKKLVEKNEKNAIGLASGTNAGDVWAQIGLGYVTGPLYPIFKDMVADAVNKKQAKDTLGKEENQLALRQAASYAIQSDNLARLNKIYDEEEAITIMNKAVAGVDSLYESMDWNKFAEDNYKDLKNKLKKLKDLYTSSVMDIAEQDTLAGSIKEYKEGINDLTIAFGANSQEVANFKKEYANYDMLKNYEDTVRTLEASGEISGGQILNLVSSMRKLDITSDAVGKTLDKLAKQETNLQDSTSKLVDDMISKRFDYSKEGLKYWSELTGQTEEKLQDAIDDGTFDGLVTKLIDYYSELATGGITTSNIKEYRDRITSNTGKRGGILEEIAKGELSTESKDYLSEYFGELYANPKFQDALASGSADAMTMFKNAVEEDNKNIIDYSNRLLEKQKNLQEGLLSEYGFKSYENFLNRESEVSSEVANTIKQNQINIQNIKDSIEDMENLDLGVEKIDEFGNNITRLDAKINKFQNESIKNFDEIGKLYQEKIDLANQEFDNISSTTMQVMGISKEKFESLYEVIDGELIPNAKELNGLYAEQLYIWQQNEEALAEAVKLAHEATEGWKESQEEDFDTMLDAQDKMLELYKSKLEKENEALQESLDKRSEMYEKYFDWLEGEEETQDYETERQKLINRIANLSVATDSESLASLKAAQQELADLNKDRATSQRELRREAVAERFEAQKEQLEKDLNDTLKDGNGLLKDLIYGLESGKLTLFSLGADSGAFDGMTTLGITNWFKEYSPVMGSFGSYVADYINSINNGIFSPDTGSSNNITNNNSSVNIVNTINSANRLSESERIELNKKIEDFFIELLNNYGINPNSNAY